MVSSDRIGSSERRIPEISTSENSSNATNNSSLGGGVRPIFRKNLIAYQSSLKLINLTTIFPIWANATATRSVPVITEPSIDQFDLLDVGFLAWLETAGAPQRPGGQVDS